MLCASFTLMMLFLTPTSCQPDIAPADSVGVIAVAVVVGVLICLFCLSACCSIVAYFTITCLRCMPPDHPLGEKARHAADGEKIHPVFGDRMPHDAVIGKNCAPPIIFASHPREPGPGKEKLRDAVFGVGNILAIVSLLVALGTVAGGMVFFFVATKPGDSARYGGSWIFLVVTVFFGAYPGYMFCSLWRVRTNMSTAGAPKDVEWVKAYAERVSSEPFELFHTVLTWHFEIITSGYGDDATKEKVTVFNVRKASKIDLTHVADTTTMPDFDSLPNLLHMTTRLEVEAGDEQTRDVVARQREELIQENIHTDKFLSYNMYASCPGILAEITFAKSGRIPCFFRPPCFFTALLTMWGWCYQMCFRKAFTNIEFNIVKKIYIGSTPELTAVTPTTPEGEGEESPEEEEEEGDLEMVEVVK